MKVKLIVALVLAIVVSLPSLSMGENTHAFDCSECHNATGTIHELSNNNVCLQCHNDAKPDVTLFAGSRYNPGGTYNIGSLNSFDDGDASNALDSNPTYNSAETSHHWAVSTTYNAAAGSREPNRTLHPRMFSNYNISNGRVTCSRCHDPHGNYLTNPKLLRLSADGSTPMTEDELCVACHSDFAETLGAVSGNNGLMTHPILDSAELNAILAADLIDNPTNPTYNMAAVQNYNSAAPYTNSAVLIEGGVSCSSCHGPHFSDSNSSTSDGPGATGGDGMLLRSDGQLRSDPVSYNGVTNRYNTALLRSNLCQDCHAYKMHGDPTYDSSPGSPNPDHRIGCLDCHGGHSYNNNNPSLYVLSDASPDAVPTRIREVYNSTIQVTYPHIVSTSTRGNSATLSVAWDDDVEGTALGFCEVCHGDVNDNTIGGLGKGSPEHLVGKSKECSECHQHNDSGFAFKLDSSVISCGGCHGFPPYKDVPGNRVELYDAADGGYAISGDLSYNYNSSSGHYKPESTTAHRTHAGRDLLADGGLSPLPNSEKWYFYGNTGDENCRLCHGPNSGDDLLGNHKEPGALSTTFRNVPFNGIAFAPTQSDPTYDSSGGGTCSNVYCHSVGAPRTGDSSRDYGLGIDGSNIPDWSGTGGTDGYNSLLISANRCSSCHGNEGPSGNNSMSPVGSGGMGNSPAHLVHIEPPFNYACGVCHENSAIDKNTLSDNATDHRGSSGGLHVNGVQDVVYNSTVINGTLAIDKNNYNSTTGTCSVYCHDADNTGRSADWDVLVAMDCDSCHAGATISSGTHTRHVSDPLGPQLACSDCHDTGADTGTNAGHIDGQLILNSALLGVDGDGPLVADTADICLNCHGYDGEAGEVMPKWSDPNTTDCATCHAGSACGATFDGQTPPLLQWARTGGHDRKDADNSAYPSGYRAAEADCLTCHVDDSPNHWDRTSYASSTDELDLLLLYNTAGFAPAPYVGQEDLYCANCHGDAPSRNHPTHFAQHADNQNMNTHKDKKCVACHNVHGEENNLTMIWSAPGDQILHDQTSTGKYAGANVVFTNRTNFADGNLNSYDEDDGNDGVHNTAILENNADDICAVCHSQAAGITHNNIDNKSTNLTHSGAPDQLGTDCFECHSAHNAADPADVFLPGAGTSCVGCHLYPPLSGAHLLHSATTNDDGSDDRSDCAYCHGADVLSYTYAVGEFNHNVSKDYRQGVLNTTVGFNNAATLSDNTDDTCTNACHNTDLSDGTWGGDVDGLDCDKCHYYSNSPSGSANDTHGSVGDGRAEPISLSHSEHFDASKVCGDCHDMTGSEYNSGILGNSIPGPLAHINFNSGVIDSIAYYNGAALAEPNEAGFDEGGGVRDVLPSLGYNDSNTCSTATTGCHATGAAEWYTPIDDGNAGCLECHTDTLDSNFNPTSGLHNNAAPLTVTGNAHDGSFYNGSTLAVPADCVTCHTTDPSSGHMDGNLLGTQAVIDLAVGYNATNLTCNTNCHLADKNGTSWAYKWSDTAYNQDGTQCANCHGVWDDFRAGVKHRGAVYATDPKPKDTHGTGTLACRDCHAIESATGYTYNAVNADWDDNDPAVTGLTAETSHHGNGTITINYNGPTFGRNGSGLSGCGPCHALYDGTSPGQFSYNTTTWSPDAVVNGDVVESTCSQCHGGRYSETDASSYWPANDNAPDDVDKNNRGAHDTHIFALAEVVFSSDSPDFNTAITNLLTDNTPNYLGQSSEDKQRDLCSYCHVTPAALGDTDHIDSGLPAEVNSMYTLWDKTLDNGFYSNLSSGDDTCATVDCHFNKTTPDGVYGWYDGNDGDCVMCHVDVMDGSTVDSNGGTHVAHMNSAVLGTTANFGMSIACDDCHGPGSVAWDTNAPTTSDGVAPTSNHIDGTFTIDGGSVIDGTTNVYTTDVGCGTNECHNDGKGGAPAYDTSPDYRWGVALTDCDICHADPPTATAAHADHMASTTYVPNGCDECHTAADDIKHIDAKVDFGGAITSPLSNSGWDNTCANDCHASALGETLWSSTTVVNCVDCHAGSYVGGDNWRSSGTNYNSVSGLHATTANNVAAHNDNVTDSIYCVDCHLDYDAAPASHIDNVWEDDLTSNTETRFLKASAMTYGELAPESSTCSGTGTALSSCHSDGGNWFRLWSTDADVDYVASPSPSQAVCNVCHGTYLSITNSTGWREGTVHFRSGSGAGELKGDGSHTPDDPNQCEACHGYDSAISHELGTITFSGSGSTFTLESGTSGWYCANCHNDRSAEVASATGTHTFLDSLAFPTSINYVAGSETPEGGCTSCHGSTESWPLLASSDVADYPNRDGKHTEHVHAIAATMPGGDTETNRDNTCDYCHENHGGSGPTHDDGTEPSNDWAFSNMLNVAVLDTDVILNYAGRGATPVAPYEEVTCTNVNCHFSNSYTPQWYDDIYGPEQITDLVSHQGDIPGRLKLTWTSPGGDTNYPNTTAYKYDVRYSDDGGAVDWSADYNSATNFVGGLPITYLRGEATELNVDNLDPDKSYRFEIKTQDTAGNWSPVSNTAADVLSPAADEVEPDFYGIDSVTRGDEGGALNLWWTNAEDHSMYEMVAPYNTKPITYDIWWKDENDFGDLDMDVDSANVTGFTGTAYEIEGLVNTHTYQVGVRACDAETPKNCDDNTIIAKGTPTKVPDTPLSIDLYNSEGTLVMPIDGIPAGSSTGPTAFGEGAAGITFYAPTASAETRYYVDSFSAYIDPGNTSQNIYAQAGIWNGSSFVSGGAMGTSSFSKRSPKLATFKIADTGGVIVPNGQSIAVRLTTEASSGNTANVEYGSGTTGGTATIGSRFVNTLPGDVTGASANLNSSEAVVNIAWTAPAPDSDGLDNATEDPVHFDIYGTNAYTGSAGDNYEFVIAEELPGTTGNITWDTQADGIISGTLGVRIRAGDGYDHSEVDVAVGPQTTADALDYVAPDKIDDLVAKSRPKAGTVTLRWTTPGDDNYNNGRASAFDIRYLDSDIALTDYNSATVYKRSPAPDFGGHINELEVTGLLPDTPYWFAMKTMDEQGNLSEKSNIAGPVNGGPRCGMCHTTGPSVVESEGNHKLHGYTLNDCTKCHGAVSANYGLDHQDGQLTMGYLQDGPVVGTISGSSNEIMTYYNASGVIMYQDTDGYGGFGDGSYNSVGVGLDDGGCFNFGSQGLFGCHGLAGEDPDGGLSQYPLYNTPIWLKSANLDCGRCHGNPNRTTDLYGRDYDSTVLYNAVQDQIIGSPGADNRGGWDYDDSDVDKRKYIGQHEKHLNYSFRFSKGDSCNLCHPGHYDLSQVEELDGKHGDMIVDVKLDTIAAGPDAYYAEGTTGVAGSCGNMDAYRCHPYDETPLWDTTDNFPCIGCHTMGGASNIANIGHLSDDIAGITPDELEANSYEGNPGNCTWCHFAGHPRDDVGGTALILPNNALVGVSYASGGIHLRKDPGNNAAGPADGYQTQAELCWGCHDQQTDQISEWYADDGPGGTPNNNSATISATAGDPNYNYGFLNQLNWIGATWTSDKFSYKSGLIMSTHSTNTGGTSTVYNSIITDTNNGNTSIDVWSEDLDTLGNLQCHNCHDVHDMNFAENDEMNGPPYLRGSWVRNPYPEDGAPQSGTDFSAGQTNNNYGAVPRAGSGYNQSGGFQIDQNNPDATKGLSLSNSAGICTLCHGTVVNTMDYTSDNGGDGLWMTAGKNGHSNSALGGTPATSGEASDILNFTNAGGRHTISGTPPPELTANYADPQNPSMGYQSVNIADGATNRQVDGFRSVYKGTYGWLIEPKIDANYAYASYSWGATQDNGTINQGYHSFTCSKCHNPHASRLPKLLITNCLDTKQNSWDDGKVISGTSGGETLSPNADNNNKSFSNLTSAQNCHRLGDPAQNGGQGGTGGGWNLVTPRPKML